MGSKRYFLLFLVLLLVDCGGKSYFATSITTINNSDHFDVEWAEDIAPALWDSGYSIDKYSSRMLQTKWRYIRLFRYEYDESWVAWRLTIRLKKKPQPLTGLYAQIIGECRQQYTRLLHKQWQWRACWDKDVRRMVDTGVKYVADALRENQLKVIAH